MKGFLYIVIFKFKTVQLLKLKTRATFSNGSTWKSFYFI